jgi:hypothetical protein
LFEANRLRLLLGQPSFLHSYVIRAPAIAMRPDVARDDT